MAKSRKLSVDRRGFIKGAAAGAAALVAKPGVAEAQDSAPRNGSARPNAVTLASETGERPPGGSARVVIEHPGSDYMVDVLKSLKIEYVAANPGSTFDSLHESLINYG